MTTWKELVYIALDSLKIHSDDSKFTENHVIFLLNKYRAYVLKQTYAKTGMLSAHANYQKLDVSLHSTTNNSIKDIPTIMSICIPTVYSKGDQEEITYVPLERFKYIGHNRFLSNIIYFTVDLNNKLTFNKLPTYSNGKITSVIDKCNLHAVFENALDVYEFNNSTIDILDETFPIEDILIPSILELVMKDLTNGVYKPSDNTNDAQDALSDLAGFLRRNMKSQFQKQIDE